MAKQFLDFLDKIVDYSEFDPLFAPSIMCSDPWDYKTYLEQFEACNIDLIHFDVMDGQFVPNIMLGSETFAATHRASKLPIDLHLMTLHPERTVDYFDVHKGDWVSFHPETCNGTYRLLSKIREMGAKAGLALCPATPLDVITEVSQVLDFVLLMAVEPGFSGQKMLPNHLDKVYRTTKVRNQCGADFKIMVDGNANVETIKNNLVAGADGFVTGSSLLGGDFVAENFAEDYAKFREDIGLKPF